MTEPDTSEDLASALGAGVAALREGRAHDAVHHLGPVYASDAWGDAPDLADVRASVCSLYAQALLEAGRPHDADRPCRDAIRLLRAARDRTGLDAVRGLQDRIVRRIAHDAERAQRLAEQARIAATPLEELLADAHDDASRAEVLVKKAQAHHDTGDDATAAPLALRAFEAATAAGHLTWQVFALVAHARSTPGDAATSLAKAYRLAERGEEFNLVSVTASAARELGVALPTEAGPHAPLEGSR